ncbi:hypothetical protein [Maioricimonas sp. JC845]|uniref:hypothetical protein n=1 Tax=Maioricimonas sp. JC845 TaxID=3232138 RepID=UPI00345AE1C8
MSTTDTDTPPADVATEFRLRVVHHSEEVESAEQSFRDWKAEWEAREQQMEQQLCEIENELARISGPAERHLRLYTDAGE